MADFVFIKPSTAILPEVHYYSNFLSKHYPKAICSVLPKLNIDLLSISPKIVWYIVAKPKFLDLFILLVLKIKGTKVVFDYRSGSIGKFGYLSNLIKVVFQGFVSPHLLVYLNQYVYEIYLGKIFGRLPHKIIDMPSYYPNFDYSVATTAFKKYRILCFVKSVDQLQIFLDLRSKIANQAAHLSDYLILSDDLCLTSHLFDYLSCLEALIVTRQVPHAFYMSVLSQSFYNLIIYPNISPYKYQTSTRFIDSLAASSLPICTSTFSTREFVRIHNLGDYICLFHSLDDILTFFDSRGPIIDTYLHSGNYPISLSSLIDAVLTKRQIAIDAALSNALFCLLD